MPNYINIKNNQSIDFSLIPVLDYLDFLEFNTDLMNDETNHCVQYFGYKKVEGLRLICCMANDNEGNIKISSSEINLNEVYPSFSEKHLSFHVFEREMHENFGIKYSNHPWLKPIRFPFNRADKNSTIANYPFYEIESEELHEVGVGPIHAGVIEPGHFRFICNGEQILHLEIQLGFQHRGIEQLMLEKKNLLQRNILAESIAGDTVVGHTVAFSNLWESLCGFQATEDMQFARTFALEWERIAIHTGDLSAICTDIAYQLGSSVFGRLRTPIINTFQVWCGNRLAKSLIRAGKNQFPFTKDTAEAFTKTLDAYQPHFDEVYERMKNLPSVLARLEKTGVVTNEQGLNIGAVGMAARMCYIERDIRKTHPHDLYKIIEHIPVLKKHGDVYSRTQIRKDEIYQSMEYVRYLMKNIPEISSKVPELKSPQKNLFTLSLIEGWRGEICHCAITDDNGELAIYKIKDPSLHNWLALALAVRNNEISDFPICNKSFNLSYCGNDL
jgi:Ni,Fe-hydrogenase III large subunit